MDRLLLSKLIACFLFIFPCVYAFSVEENFLLINGVTDEVVFELGPHINEYITPCSTFKIVLSLMGYDAGILKDEKTPTWTFQEGYDEYLDSWKTPQTPQSWMKTSCLWYSKVLALQLGLEKIQNYLALLEYGNQDMSGGLTDVAWVNSSLKISPRGQVDFIQKMIHGKLPISSNAIQRTKVLLFVDELPEGWKLFGKTGWGGSIREQDSKNLEVGWFIGWVEKDNIFFPFAYNIRERKINLAQRIPRVKQLLVESNVMTEKCTCIE
jgi:beta-lactamase class D